MAIEEHVCLISQAGPAMNNAGQTPQPMVLFLLSDVGGAFTDVWFYAPQPSKNQMLAVALAAISTQSQVHVFLETPVAGTATQVYNMYLMAWPSA